MSMGHLQLRLVRYSKFFLKYHKRQKISKAVEKRGVPIEKQLPARATWIGPYFFFIFIARLERGWVSLNTFDTWLMLLDWEKPVHEFWNLPMSNRRKSEATFWTIFRSCLSLMQEPIVWYANFSSKANLIGWAPSRVLQHVAVFFFSTFFPFI